MVLVCIIDPKTHQNVRPFSYIFFFVLFIVIFNKTANCQCSVILDPFSDICLNNGSIALTGGTPIGGIYFGPGVSGGNFDPLIAGTGIQTIGYTFTDSLGCVDSASASFDVLELPSVNLSAFSDVCLNTSPFVLSNGTPGGGTYFGPGVSGGSFDPGVAGAGVHQLGYARDSAGCSDTAYASINVLSLPAVSLDSLADVCENATPFALSGGLPAGGTYSGTGVSAGIFDPSSAGVGTHLITYAYTGGNGCSNSVSQNISVLFIPDASISDYTSSLPNAPFTGCDVPNTDFNLIVDNTSTTISTNVNYTIDWGDGSTAYSSPTMPLTGTTHLYTGVGFFTIILTVEGQNGCIADSTINVFNGSSPPVGFPQPGNTTGICIPDSITVDITNTSINQSGTTYTITNNSGDPPVVFQHPPPTTYTHIYTTSSCGAVGGNSPNVYYLSMRAENPCGYSDQTVQPITTSIAPTADFSISPDSVVCVNSNILFSDSSADGMSVVLDHIDYICDSTSKRHWEISPGIGWSLQTGSLGNPNPSNNPSTWGSSVIDVLFTVEGEYFISMIIENICGPDTLTKKVCIVPEPIASFDLDTTSGCVPLEVNAANTSNSLTDCVAAAYTWDVQLLVPSCGYPSSWSFINGTNPGSVHASFSINNPGQYVVSLQVINKCNSIAFSDTINVKAPPQVTASAIPDFCDSASITPSAIYDSCSGFITSYNWGFVGGSPASSVNEIPGTISYATDGVYNVTIDATNACGTSSDTASFTITKSPNITMPLGDSICFGDSISIVPTISDGTPSFTYSWTPGAGLSSDIVLDPSASPSSDITYTLSVLDNAGCTDTDSISFVVYAIPSVDAGTDQTICLGDSAVLSASVSSGNPSYTYTWSPSIGLSSTNVLDPTATPISDQFYTLTVSDSLGCESLDSVLIVVSSLIVDAGNDTVACINGPLQLDAVVSGGTAPYTYDWSPSGGLSDSTISDPVILVTGIIALQLTVIDANNCFGMDSVLILDIGLPSPAFTMDIDTGCSPLTVNFTDLSSPGVTWSWDFGDPASGSNTSTDSTTSHAYTNTSFLNDSTFTATLVVTNIEGCSDSTDTALTVIARPLADFSFVSPNICSIDTGFATNSSGAKPPATYLWSVTSPNPNGAVISDSTAFEPFFTFPFNQLSNDSTYTVLLVVTSTDGCVDSVTQDITINRIPLVDFTITAEGCGPLDATVSNNTVNVSSTYLWSASSLSPYASPVTFTPDEFAPSPVVSFAANDSVDSIIYTIHLVATSVDGCMDSLTRDVVIYLNPFVDFILSDTGGCQPQAISTTNISDPQNGEPIGTMAFSWYVNGSLYSNGQDTSFNFTNPSAIDSNISVCLAATNSYGCVDSVCHTVTIYPDPIADFTATTTDTCALFIIDGSIITLNAYPQANDTYDWYADGSSIGSGLAFPGDTILSANDSVQIMLVTTNAHSCVPDTLIMMFYTGDSLVAAFTMDIDTGCSPLTVNFTDLSTPGVTWSWDFGDPASGSNTSTDSTTVHIYDNPGQNDSVFITTLTVSSVGCQVSVTDSILVWALPFPSFSATEVCLNDSTSFTDQTISYNSSIIGWAYDFGDGDSTYSQSPLHMYSSEGIYAVILSVTDLNGCMESFTDSIYVRPPPTANFNTAYTCLADYVCQDSSITFFDSSFVAPLGGNINSWSWDMYNDGSIDYNSNPAITTLLAGTVEVELLVMSQYGCIDSIVKSIEVNVAPTASFSIDSTSGCGPLLINITQQSSGVIDTYEWLIYGADLNTPLFTSTDSALFSPPLPTLPAPFYADTTYYIMLIASNCCGQDTAVDSVVVFPSPSAVFSPSATYGCSPFTVSFNADSLTFGSPDSLVYDWGDGNTTTIYPFTVPPLEWEVVNHTFPYTGFASDTTYVVSMTAYNDCGTTTMTSSITVEPDSVNASFIVVNNAGCAPFNGQFIDLSTGTGSSTWNFDFDSLNPGSGFVYTFSQDTVTFTFDSGGTFLIAQTVFNGCSSDTMIQSITVYDQPVASFTTPSDLCLDSIVQFIDSSVIANGSISAYLWDFGDSSTSNQPNPAHLYQASGTYTVTLIVTSNSGCTDTAISTIIVFPKPQVDFSALNTCFNEQPVAFTNSSTISSGTMNFLWDFGDSSGSVAVNPSHTYLTDGTYIVSLSAISSNSCVADTSIPITIYPSPVSEFSYTFLNADSCGSSANVNFTNNTSGSNTYSWDFNFSNPGQDTSDSNSPSFYYAAADIYEVLLVSINQFGCPDSVRDTLTVYPDPTANFSLSGSASCQNLEVQFSDSSTYIWSNTGNIVTWYWDFGDGASDTNQFPVHSFDSAGLFDVQLIVITDVGCTYQLLSLHLILIVHASAIAPILLICPVFNKMLPA